MIQIDTVDISYFRSIYRLKLRNLKDISILSGRNDVGKSNILKALNLFFNNETDWQTPFDFQKDFSRQRLSKSDKIPLKKTIRPDIDWIHTRGPLRQESTREVHSHQDLAPQFIYPDATKQP